MRTTRKNWHAVLLADVIESRAIPRFASWRDQRLRRSSAAHRAAGLIRFDYTVTAWDEFQTVASHPKHIAQIAFDLRRRFHPGGLRIGIGIGAADLPRSPRGRLNEQAGGEAFILARQALKDLDDSSEQRRGRITQLRTPLSHLNVLGELLFGLQDALVQSISPRQWASIDAFLSRNSQEAAARRLGVDKSTVSRALRRAHYWQIESSLRSAHLLLETQLHDFVQL